MTAISGVSNSSSAWAAMAAQRQANQAQAFAKVDTDGSGSVDGTELQGALDDVASKTGGTAGNAQDLIGQYDANGDGSLSADELGSAMPSILPPPSTMEFAQSHSGDGASAGGGGGGGGGGGKVEAAGGGSGGSGSTSTTYDPLDTDQDGVVSAAELAAAGISSPDTTDATDAAGGTDPLAALSGAVDGNSDGKVEPSETDLLMQKIEGALSSMSATTSTTASQASGSDGNGNGNGQDPSQPFDLQHLAQMVLQQYDQVANNDTQTSTSTLKAVA